MSRDKQIEEMVFALTESQHEFDKAWKECLHNNAPMPDRENVFYAKYLVENKGYRKASDVAEEIFAEIEHTARAAIILLKFEKDEKLRNTKTECYTDLIGYIAELKKKYTEGGE